MNQTESLSLQEDQQIERREFMEEETPNEANLTEASTPDEKSSKKGRPERETFSPEFISFQKVFNEQKDVEGKLQVTIEFMEQLLTQKGMPHFRNFWEARRICLPLFKENISPMSRSLFWNKYSELSKEARRLKDILDEQSSFAAEQIEIAIVALEKEIVNFDEQMQRNPFVTEGPFPEYLLEHKATYESLQGQLNLLNTQASRINALRKEILRTDMRVKQKNKFFQQLSAAGDSVFPKRKDLIKLVSQQFVDDVESFIKEYLSSESFDIPLFQLREEIKALQGLAKLLTLNTTSFTSTRGRLSECWDRVKVEEKERKKERLQQRVIYKQNAELIYQAIATAHEALTSGQLSVPDCQKKMDEIQMQIRNTQLGRDELKSLRDEYSNLRMACQQKVNFAEEQRLNQEKELQNKRREKFNLLKIEIDLLVKNTENDDAETLVSKRQELLSKIQESQLIKAEKHDLERLLKPLNDVITEKKEQALLSLSDDDRQALGQLQEVIKQRKDRRQEIKLQLEHYRRLAGSSALDFEKAMTYNAHIQEEKERLERANQGIQEVEAKIVELQSNIKKMK